MSSFRDTLIRLCPPWLRRGTAAKILYAIGIHLDVLVVFLEAAIKIRFPGVYSPESLPMIGRERRIPRGPQEPASTYSARLERWLDDHATRGGPYALLAQLHAYYAANPFPVRLVYRSGRAFDMDADGNVTRLDVTWEPDTEPEKWARWWMIYQWPGTIGPARTLGEPGLTLDGSWVLGSGLTPAELYDLRLVPTEWNAGHAIGELVLVMGGAWVLGPTRALGEPGLVLGGGNVVKVSVR